MESKSPKRRGARPKIGWTIDGVEYVTTHSCPSCHAIMETVGAGYPQLVCGKCRMLMVPKPKRVDN